MKKILILLTCFFISSSFAASNDFPNYGWYIGLTAGTASDTGENNEQLKGASGGFLVGYRWYNWALEFNYDYFAMKTKSGLSEFHLGSQVYIDKGELKGSAKTLTLKGFAFRYLMFGFGLGFFDATHDFRFHDPNNPSTTAAFEGDDSYAAAFTQIGIVLPLYRHLDLRAYYEVRNIAGITPAVSIPGSYEPEPLSGTIKQFAAQVIYYFN